MTKKNGAIPVAAGTAPRDDLMTGGSISPMILTQPAISVKPGKSRADQLRFLHRKAPAAEIIKTVQQISPRFSKVELSKAENDTYGIEIGKDELTALWLKYAPVEYEKLKRKDRHRLTKRIACRVSDQMYDSIISYCRREGITVNTMLLTILVEYFGGEA